MKLKLLFLDTFFSVTKFGILIHEIIWYLQGATNIKYLVDNNVHIWDEWADENGDLGPIYGYQWRKWGAKQTGTITSAGLYQGDIVEYETQGIDQIADVITKLRKNPDDRRIIVSAWNVSDIPSMMLPELPSSVTLQ